LLWLGRLSRIITSPGCNVGASWVSTFANNVPQPLGPQPFLQPHPDTVVAHVDALEEEAHEAGLLGRKQLVPDAVEVAIIRRALRRATMQVWPCGR
jgi:hypothetical protein